MNQDISYSSVVSSEIRDIIIDKNVLHIHKCCILHLILLPALVITRRDLVQNEFCSVFVYVLILDEYKTVCNFYTCSCCIQKFLFQTYTIFVRSDDKPKKNVLFMFIVFYIF